MIDLPLGIGVLPRLDASQAHFELPHLDDVQLVHDKTARDDKLKAGEPGNTLSLRRLLVGLETALPLWQPHLQYLQLCSRGKDRWPACRGPEESVQWRWRRLISQ